MACFHRQDGGKCPVSGSRLASGTECLPAMRQFWMGQARPSGRPARKSAPARASHSVFFRFLQLADCVLLHFFHCGQQFGVFMGLQQLGCRGFKLIRNGRSIRLNQCIDDDLDDLLRCLARCASSWLALVRRASPTCWACYSARRSPDLLGQVGTRPGLTSPFLLPWALAKRALARRGHSPLPCGYAVTSARVIGLSGGGASCHHGQ